MKKKKSSGATTAKNLEERFDAGESVIDYFDTNITRINLDLPKWMIEAIDRESERCGIARQALIKIWLVQKLDRMRAPKKA